MPSGPTARPPLLFFALDDPSAEYFEFVVLVSVTEEFSVTLLPVVVMVTLVVALLVLAIDCTEDSQFDGACRAAEPPSCWLLLWELPKTLCSLTWRKRRTFTDGHTGHDRRICRRHHSTGWRRDRSFSSRVNRDGCLNPRCSKNLLAPCGSMIQSFVVDAGKRCVDTSDKNGNGRGKLVVESRSISATTSSYENCKRR